MQTVVTWIAGIVVGCAVLWGAWRVVVYLVYRWIMGR